MQPVRICVISGLCTLYVCAPCLNVHTAPVCVICYLLAATCGPKGHGSGLPLPMGQQRLFNTTISWPISFSPDLPNKGKTATPFHHPKGRQKDRRLHAWGARPRPPSSPSSPGPPISSPSLSSGRARLVLMHSALVSLGISKTASVDFSPHSYFIAGALGFFHPWALPIAPHIFRVCGSQALHSVKRWWRICCFPPLHHQHLSSAALWVLFLR